MSHIRDIQKLRQAKNIRKGFGHRFSRPQSQINSSAIEVKNLGVTLNKFITSKQLLQKSKQKNATHRRGSSSGIYYERKQPQGIKSGLSKEGVLNLFEINNAVKGSQRIANPLTSRKQRPNYVQSYKQVQVPQKFQRTERKNKIAEKQSDDFHAEQKMNKNNYSILYPIGKGGFGKVWKVECKKTKTVFAMKEMYKAKIIQKKSIDSVMNERSLLTKVSHPFLINIYSAFQDRENLYLLMDYLDGGDLRYHIGNKRKFPEKETKFLIANMIIGLEYLHENKIIHRDMKPENLVFDSDGYLRITDLGISRVMRDNNYQDTSGTPGYMAPEVISRKNHSFSVDFFAVGVIAYEMMMGRRPYLGRNRKQIRDQILSKQASIKNEQIPSKWSYQSANFINKLLQRNPTQRLGNDKISEIKSHPWFEDISWQKLLNKQIPAPFIPISIEDNYEDYKDQISEDTVDENLEQNLLMLRNKDVQCLFEGYHLEDVEHRKKKNTFIATEYIDKKEIKSEAKI